MIDFPCEPDDKASEQRLKQLLLAGWAATETKRIRSIGLAGHYLMRRSQWRIL
jgi:hypothetical protein